MVRGNLLKLLLVFLSCSLAAFAVICLVVVLWGIQVSATSPKSVAGISSSAPALDAWAISPGQLETLAEWGYPESFAILFYDEEMDDRTIETTRYETWSYFTRGTEVTFVNGEKTSEASLQPAIVLLAPIPYRPERFAAYMTLPQVVRAGRLAAFTEIPLESQLLPGGKTYFADRLTFGVKDGELRYIETLPLVD